MKNLIKRFLGSASEKKLVIYRARLPKINALAGRFEASTDNDLRTSFADCRRRRENGEPADDLLSEVFAIVREVAWRTLKMRHFDVQLLGGMALFDGHIAEMKTGEGKTLVATLPVCLEALSGLGVHLVTVNDYLAQRDADWMGEVYRFLGLSVGINLSKLSPDEKKSAYACDVTYGTNNEFGFDYLRDNMRYGPEQRAQRKLNYAIVDEVDSILIDEARTPLIISGEADYNVDYYRLAAQIALGFNRCETPESPGDFTMDEKTREIHLTEEGFQNAEDVFAKAKAMKAGSLYDAVNLSLLHHLNAALKARFLFIRDRDYVVQDEQIIIVDEFTGRLMPGRRWGDGQHQAVEAKENVTVQKENQTLASISFQNYFRLYQKLSGMTGTASTEAEEFRFIYRLQTIEIPPHQKMVRQDELDRIYRTAAAKERAIMTDISDCATRKQPVLVGTTAIEDSEKLSKKLSAAGLKHEVLNAKHHASEAQIISQAGKSGAITIATNMAGRGTDIVLGGNIEAEKRALLDDNDNVSAETITALEKDWQKRHEAVLAAGGLRIVGAERNESRRIDNQLRGRSGRQGDPGSSIFYLSFEDSLLRIFASQRISKIMERLKIDEDEAIEARMVSRTIENAQRKVESHNFDIRRQLLEYDDIANEQRRLVYEQREHILMSDDINAIAQELRKEHLSSIAEVYMPPETPEEEWRVAELERLLISDFRLQIPISEWVKTEEEKPRDYFIDKLVEAAEAAYVEKTNNLEEEQYSKFLRSLILNIFDDNWRSHLSALDSLRLSIGLRGMAQKNPKQEYKREAFEMFQRFLEAVKGTTAKILYALNVRNEKEEVAEAPTPTMNLKYRHDKAPTPSTMPEMATADNPTAAADTTTEAPAETPDEPVTIRRATPKIKRNSPCSCGSGKKYKQCCGRL